MTKATKICSLLFMAYGGTLNAGAMPAQPILTKQTSSGFVPAEWKRKETCEVFRDRITVTRIFGESPSLMSVENRSHTLTGNYARLLRDAAGAKLTTTASTTIDGPSYEYAGYIDDGSKLESVLLKKDDGVHGIVSMNPSSSATLLINTLDGLCPKVFD